MSGSYLPKAVRAEGRRKGHADQIEAIGQHGENTILRLQSGDLPMPIVSPAEEQLFRGLGRTPPQSGGQARAPSGGASVRSRLSSESWGSFQSNSASELRRIHELGDKARAIGKKHAAVHQVEPLQQRGEKTILGIAKGQMPGNL